MFIHISVCLSDMFSEPPGSGGGGQGSAFKIKKQKMVYYQVHKHEHFLVLADLKLCSIKQIDKKHVGKT